MKMHNIRDSFVKLRSSSVRLWSSFIIGVCIVSLVTGFVREHSRNEVRESLVGGYIQYNMPSYTTRPLTNNESNIRRAFSHKIGSKEVIYTNSSLLAKRVNIAKGATATREYQTENLSAEEAINYLLMSPYSEGRYASSVVTTQRLKITPFAITQHLAQQFGVYENLALKKLLLTKGKHLNTSTKTLVLRAMQYRDIVEKYGKEYNLSPNLLYAIICVESSGNPAQISNRSAYGLMQVVPKTAGVEVHRWLGLSGLPKREALLHPETNIRYGTLYLHLLMSKYFLDIKDPSSREYCAIAAYNIGVSGVLRAFGQTSGQAFAKINKYRPGEVKERLLSKLAAKETRDFLKKVLRFKESFVALL